MGSDLVTAIVVFLASAISTIFLGAQLSRYGDVLATLTGWGRLFVGSILIAMATSLPEVSTSISAVRLHQPNPELAVGNVLGANMINMFTLSLVALFFGGRRFLQRVAPQQGYLILLAALMTGLAVLFGSLRWEASFWQVGPASGILLVVFLAGMWVVYRTRPQNLAATGEQGQQSMSLATAWLRFGLVSAGVVLAGIFLAWSADRIADITGVASSTLGILAVSVVTTMPEAASTVAAVRMGAVDLGVGGLYGSCAFNVTILAVADPFYRGGVVINRTEPAHFVAGGVAIVLILAGLALIMGWRRIGNTAASVSLALMALTYIAGAVVVVRLGVAKEAPSPATLSAGQRFSDAAQTFGPPGSSVLRGSEGHGPL